MSNADRYLENTQDKLRNVSKEIEVIINLIKKYYEDNDKFIDTDCRDILVSTYFMMLYSLIEVVFLTCVEAVEESIRDNIQDFTALNKDLKELLHSYIKNQNEKENKMLKGSIEYSWNNVKAHFCINISRQNISEEEINKFLTRIGANKIQTRGKDILVKHDNKDRLKGVLWSVRAIRNILAHGGNSFGENGNGRTLEEIEEYFEKTQKYLKLFIKELHKYIEQEQYRA